MENIQNTLANYSNQNNKNNFSNFRTIVTKREADELINSAIDLINNQEFRPYFFKTLYVIGPAKFRQAMEIARDAKAGCQPCLFAKVLKNMRYQAGAN